MSVVPLNPRPMLNALIGKEIIVRLKWTPSGGGTQEYKGILITTDPYMNLQLEKTTEYIDKNSSVEKNPEPQYLGSVLIRCNNVLWVSASEGKTENGDEMKS
ncbi:small nuclear ribonucleoprotein SmF [Rhizodiscina lignyota]|uniref:Sm protein F n=1 Tax=Rhizodiscina lignyota TaxID=1504668 RepID=A0A9P4I5H6_9PEZI|nr:small nuclear ribonucleoprotein SmF [Rhizodiscina lignyota]